MSEVQKKKIPTIAIVSLICALIGIMPMWGFYFSIAGIILGFKAKNKISRNKEVYKGIGLAISGIALSILSILISFNLWVSLYQKAYERNRVEEAKAILSEIRNAEIKYKLKHNQFTEDIKNLEVQYSEIPGEVCNKNYYFNYRIDLNSSGEDFRVIATRCIQGGKAPQGRKAYEVSIDSQGKIKYPDSVPIAINDRVP